MTKIKTGFQILDNKLKNGLLWGKKKHLQKMKKRFNL